MKRTALIAVPLLVALAGCAQVHKLGSKIGIADDPDAPPDTCGIKKAGHVVDMPASPEVLADIRARVGEKNVRVIRPGDAVTMDFRTDRLNVEVGAGGRIERLRCG